MEQWWLPEEPPSPEVQEVLLRHTVRHAALQCHPAVANRVSHCLYDHEWRQGGGQRQPSGDIAFQLNYAGVRALDGPEPHPLAELLQSGQVRVVRDLVVRGKAESPARPPEEEGKQKPAFTFVELFAGIGGFRVACEALGGRCVFAAELNREARQTYEANFGCGGPLAGDVRAVEAARVPPHDLLTAGFPCQSFTSAGPARGFQDERGQLFFEVVRLLEAARPAAFVLENVPHLAKAEGGLALRVVLAALQGAGYRVAWRVLDGGRLLAQARSRLFLVGARDGRAFAWPELPALGLAWRDAAEEDAAGREELRLSAHQRAAMRNVPQVRPELKVRTVMASYKRSHRLHSQFVPLPEGGFRFMSPREVARVQGFPGAFRLDRCLNPNAVYAQLGNAVPPPLACAVVASLMHLDPEACRRLAMDAIRKL